MKVLHIHEHLSWTGGIETYLLELMPRLESLGHPQVIAYANGDGSLFGSSVHMPEIAMSGKTAQRRGFEAVREIVGAHKPDIVHLHQTFNLGVIKACLAMAPTIIHGHDYRYLCPASNFFHRRSRTICNRISGMACFPTTLVRHCMTPRPQYAWNYYRRTQVVHDNASVFGAVIAPSEYVRERFARAGFPCDRITTLPYFCPLQPRTSPRSIPDEPTLLFIGRIREIKGYDYFIEAFRYLPPHVRGIIVGDADDCRRRKIRALVRSADCEGRIELQSWAAREKITTCYEKCTALVFPSIWPETFGIVGIEAMACGVPAVGANVGGIPQWLTDGETGRLVPPRNARAIAEAVTQLLNPGVNREYGERAIKSVRDRFSPELHIEHLLNLYSSIANG